MLSKLKHKLKYVILGISIAVSVVIFSFNPSTGQIPVAQAIISGTSQYPHINGKVTLTETTEGLLISGAITNLSPGEHGFHIHEYGSCHNDGRDAGGHFNPVGVEHGHLLTNGFEYAHAGDFGNIYAQPDGTASWSQIYPGLTLGDSPYSVTGRAFIVHANPDDFGQPTGNAGDRIACGTISFR